MSLNGFVLPALTIGLGSIRLRPRRGFYPVNGGDVGPMQPLIAHATLEELHRDDLEITEHPVELGAPIADHAFKRPAEVIIRCGWSDSPPGSPGLVGAALGVAGVVAPVVGAAIGGLKTVTVAQSLLSGNAPKQARAIYAQLLELQNARIPFDVYTGKRVYKNMLFKTLGATTDAAHENSLLVTAVCRQVILVSTSTVKVPVNASAQGMPEKTSPIVNAGPKQLKPSALGSGFFGIN